THQNFRTILSCRYNFCALQSASVITRPLMDAPSNSRSLATVIEQLDADCTLPPRRRREIQSALRALARSLGANPADVIAEPRHLRQRLANLSPAMARVSKGRLANIRSLASDGLRRAGIKIMPGRCRAPLSPAWAALSAQLPDRKFRIGLARLIRFCSDATI